MEAQRHIYEYKVDPNADTAAARVVRMVGHDRRVLEIGSGPGSITRLLKGNGCRVTALELDEKAIEIVSEYCEQVFPCDLNAPDWAAIVSNSGKFQVVVAADVLEHLYDPWATLRAMAGLIEADGCMVVSLPHIGHNAIFACLLDEDFSYREWGLLDKTHIRFFGIRNIQQMFSDAGLKIVEAEFVAKLPEETEFADSWRRTPGALKRSLECNRFGLVYQVVVKAKPICALDAGLDLSSLPPPSRGFLRRLRGMLNPYLGLKNQARLNNLLNRMGVIL